jgi:hypothetical protein
MSYAIRIDSRRPRKEQLLSLAAQWHDCLTLLGGGKEVPDRETLLASLSKELDEQEKAKNASNEANADNE